MAADSAERVHLSVAEARELSERAMRGIGYEPEEARILADHVIDAAVCGYEYSGLPKLLNVADHPLFQARRSPLMWMVHGKRLDGFNNEDVPSPPLNYEDEKSVLDWCHHGKRR